MDYNVSRNCTADASSCSASWSILPNMDRTASAIVVLVNCPSNYRKLCSTGWAPPPALSPPAIPGHHEPDAPYPSPAVPPSMLSPPFSPEPLGAYKYKLTITTSALLAASRSIIETVSCPSLVSGTTLIYRIDRRPLGLSSQRQPSLRLH